MRISAIGVAKKSIPASPKKNLNLYVRHIFLFKFGRLKFSSIRRHKHIGTKFHLYGHVSNNWNRCVSYFTLTTSGADKLQKPPANTRNTLWLATIVASFFFHALRCVDDKQNPKALCRIRNMLLTISNNIQPLPNWGKSIESITKNAGESLISPREGILHRGGRRDQISLSAFQLLSLLLLTCDEIAFVNVIDTATLTAAADAI